MVLSECVDVSLICPRGPNQIMADVASEVPTGAVAVDQNQNLKLESWRHILIRTVARPSGRQQERKERGEHASEDVLLQCPSLSPWPLASRQ